MTMMGRTGIRTTQNYLKIQLFDEIELCLLRKRIYISSLCLAMPNIHYTYTYNYEINNEKFLRKLFFPSSSIK